MFKAETYIERRKQLAKKVGSGLLVFLGNEECPMNYAANAYHFRQDSTFLYFFGLDSPGLAAVMDLDENRTVIFGDDISLEDVIWMGHLPKLKERAAGVGVKRTAPRAAFAEYVRKARESGRTVHFLPPYRPGSADELAAVTAIPQQQLKVRASEVFIRSVVDLRMVKSREEVAEIEAALDVTWDMYSLAFRFCRRGHFEYEVAGAMEAAALCRGVRPAFPLIVTVNGQTLHNHAHDNLLTAGRLLVADAGAESARHYASDITRTIPVGGRFSRRQRDIYEIVSAAQEAGIRTMRPGVTFKEAHLKAAGVIASGLKDLGLMKGDPAEAVNAGAHALFFPHGLGHNMGLDVHDMENLGENYVGYDRTVERSQQFGLAYLRMARELKPGYVLTVEPGIYFIPALFEKWRSEGKFREFIAYDRVEKYLDFGGVRIEDDVLVTDKGRRVLGKPVPKRVEEVESVCRG